jgi:hypothetical protein
MTGINSAMTGKFSYPPVIMTGITFRFISRPGVKEIIDKQNSNTKNNEK